MLSSVSGMQTKSLRPVLETFHRSYAKVRKNLEKLWKVRKVMKSQEKLSSRHEKLSMRSLPVSFQTATLRVSFKLSKTNGTAKSCVPD